jgi:nucleoside-diphosphate-sugar epimerase
VSRGLVLVTGATGAIGPSVVRELHARGIPTRVLARQWPGPGLLPSGVEITLGDVTVSTSVADAMRGVDTVLHLAALLHVENPPLQLREEYRRVNVGGTENVVAAALREDIRRVVFVSTIAAYGDGRGQVLTEDSVPRPDTVYAETKLAAERTVLDARVSCRALGAVVRLAAVYGARVKGNYRRLLFALAGRMPLLVGDGQNRRTVVYDEDAARAVVLAALAPHAGSRIYNVTDGAIHTMADIIRAISTALGRRPPRISLPPGPIRAVLGVTDRVAKLTGIHVPVSRATLAKFTEDVAVDGSRIQQELQYAPAFDLEAGWRETIRLMRGSGELSPARPSYR